VNERVSELARRRRARDFRWKFVLGLLGLCAALLSVGTVRMSAAFAPSAADPQKPSISSGTTQSDADQFTGRRRRSRRTRQELVEQTRLGRPVRVIVGLGVEFQPEGNIQRAAVIAQRTRIAQAQGRLVSRLAAIGSSNIKQYESIPFIALEADANTMAILEGAPEVASIEEDFMRHATLAESTPLIGAPAAWAAGFAGNGQAVAILDTGLDKTHPFLAGKVVSEACYSTNSSDTSSVCPGGAPQSTAVGSGVNCPVPGCEHGTHVAGIAAGKSQAFSGVAREANIVAIQIFSSLTGCSSSEDCTGAFDSDILSGLQRVQQLAGTINIAAANLSLGGDIFNSTCDGSEPFYKAAIDNLRSLGIATVIAAGNDGSNGGVTSPACVSSAISVGSTGDGSGGSIADAISTFSNSASFLGLLAPGEYINSSVPGGGFDIFRGTSMATPHVAGAWAVLKSKLPGASVSQILQVLSGTGLSLNDARNGIIKPRIRVDMAVSALATNVCNFAVAPTAQTSAQNGEQKTVGVTTDAGCSWTAHSNVPWITINSGGTGSGSVVYTVASNIGLERSGTLVVAGTTVVVTQTGCSIITLSPTTLPSGIVGVAYNQTVAASGSTGPYTFALSSGTLPSGLTLSPAGVVSGTTTQPGLFNITIRATDANGCSGTRSYSLSIDCPTITLAPPLVAGGSLGVAYSQQITATGGVARHTFAVVGGTLPTGITLASNGLLSGTPTQAGNFDITIRATDANGCTASNLYRLQILCSENITVEPALLPSGVGGVPYSQTLGGSGGSGPYTFTSSGSLPPGLTLSSGGLLSGTPNAVGSYSFTVTAIGANGCPGSRAYTLGVSVTLGGQNGILYALRDCSGCNNEIFAFAANDQTGALTLLSGFPISTGFTGTSDRVNERLAIDRTNKRLFVLNGGSARVNVYNINPTTGALTSAIPSAVTLPGAGSWYTIAVHPSGSPLLVGDAIGRVASYIITASSATAALGSPFSTGTARPFGSTFSSNGDYFYAGGNLGDAFAGFSVNAGTGVLTSLPGSAFSTGTSYPLGYAADEAGRIFMINFAGPLRVFTTTSGIPTQVTGSPFTIGSTESVDGIVHPAGFYMAADRAGNSVRVDRINGTGAATTVSAVPGSPFVSGGVLTNALTLNPGGTLLFATNGDSRNITSYGVNSSTGALTSLGVQSSNTLGTSGRLTGIAHYFDPIPQQNPVPVIASLEPNARAAGSTAFVLTINGTGFVSGSQAKWNGADRTTSFVNGTRLSVSISAADVTSVGTANITVVNPAPGGGTSNPTAFTIGTLTVTTSAATFEPGGAVAPDSIVAAFGIGLAVGTQSADTFQLPSLILGTSVQIRDSLGVTRQAPLFFVSPQQINYLIPAGTASGEASVTITSGDGKVSAGTVQITPVSLGLFSANANGKGVAAADIVRVTAANVQTFEDVAVFAMAANAWIPRCFSLGPVGENVYPVMYGTGVRGIATSALTATIGGTIIPVTFSGPQGVYVGLDQINLGAIPRGLIGKDVVNVVIRVNGQPANTVQLCIN
jgi:subtilisin